MRQKGRSSDGGRIAMKARTGGETRTKSGGIYVVSLYERGRVIGLDSLGNPIYGKGDLISEVEGHNFLTDLGVDHVPDVVLAGGTQITSWHTLLIDGASPTLAAGDTMSSHAGWTENVAYDEATRQAFTPGAVSAGSLSNTASKAVYTMSGAGTVGAMGITSDNAKSGTAGTLFSLFAFASAQAYQDTNILEVQYTYTHADDGV